MAEQLEIVDIRIGTPRPSQFTATEQRLDLAIDVRNNSKNTLHAISSVRALNYDPATQTLYVGLSEPELGPEIKPSNFIMPHTITLPPGETTTLNVSVPLVIRKIVPSTQLGLGTETLDVSGLRNVQAEISFAPTPFYPKPDDAPESISRELRSWGEKTQKKLSRSPSPETPRPAEGPRRSRKKK
jgi:hypothetical protein